MTQYPKKPNILDSISDLIKRVTRLETRTPVVYSIGTTDVGQLTIDLATGNLVFTDKNGHATTVVTST